MAQCLWRRHPSLSFYLSKNGNIRHGRLTLRVKHNKAEHSPASPSPEMFYTLWSYDLDLWPFNPKNHNICTPRSFPSPSLNRGRCERFILITLCRSATRALICLVTLTFDLLTLKLLHITVRGVGNLPTNFGVSGTFRSRIIGHHLSDTPRDLSTLTFDLDVMALVSDTGLHAPSLPYLTFVGLHFRNIWHTHTRWQHWPFGLATLILTFDV